MEWWQATLLWTGVLVWLLGCQQTATPTAVAHMTATTAVTMVTPTAVPTVQTATPPAAPTAVATVTPAPPTATALPTVTATPSPLPTETLAPTAAPTRPPTATVAAVPEAIIELDGAELPPGFSLIRYATVPRPTSLTFDAHGRLFVTATDGAVHMLPDADGDGRADQDHIFASGFQLPLGIAFHPETGAGYVSSTGRITIVQDSDGDDIADLYERLVEGLPTGLHLNNTPRFGADGWLYMGVGSTCDACEEADPRSATIMRFDPQTGEGEVFASGMRNPYDLAFHPLTGEMFATSNGRDDLGDDLPPEELNHIMQGHDYGWPDCWGELEGPDCAGTTPAVAFFRAHSSANSLAFYTADQFPPPYQNQLFVTIWGTWLISGVQAGIQQVSLRPEGDSYAAVTDWFLKVPDGVMPLGIAIGPDGALYFGDYSGEAVYRVSYGVPSSSSR